MPREREEMLVRRRSPRFPTQSSAERDDTLSEASSAPDRVVFRCQENDTRRQSAPLPVAWTGQLKHAARTVMNFVATIPETLPARDLLQGLARAVHEESCGVISELHSVEQRQLNDPRPAPVPHQTTDSTRGGDIIKDDKAFTLAIGQKRIGNKAGGKVWELISTHGTRDEALSAVQSRPHGVRFRRSSDNGVTRYFFCLSHEEESCPCKLRVTQAPSSCDKPGAWLLERADGHVCDELVLKDNLGKVKLRDTSHIKDAFGSVATGVHTSKYCRDGRQRGVHPSLQAAVLQLRKAGTMPAAIRNNLLKMHEQGDVHVKSKADLPSTKQITNFLAYAHNDAGELTLEEVQRFLFEQPERQAPNSKEEHESLRDSHVFALRFELKMLSDVELSRTAKCSSVRFGTLRSELEALQAHVVLLTSKTMMDDARALVDAWGDSLPLGADGCWGFLNQRYDSMLCSIGGRSNSYDLGTASHRQEFRAFGFGWHASESAIVPIALFAAVRHYLQHVLRITLPKVKVWNSDDHGAYAILREIFFPTATYCPCSIHIVRRITEGKVGGHDEHTLELAEQVTLMKHAGSQSLYEHVRRASLDIWQRKGVSECEQFLERLQEKPFHATRSGLPGHVCDNQPIESLQNVVRMHVGRRKHSPRTFMRTVLWDLLSYMSRRLHDNSERRHVFTVTTAVSQEAMQQLKALQTNLGDEFPLRWRRRAHQIPRQDVPTYILPALSVENQKTKRSKGHSPGPRGYKVKVPEVTANAAEAYFYALSMSLPIHSRYDCTSDIHNAVGKYNMIQKIRPEDVQGLPAPLAEFMLHMGWRCNCLEYYRRVQCGHVYFGRYIDDPQSRQFFWADMAVASWCRPRNIRKTHLPGLRDLKKGDGDEDEFELSAYENISNFNRRKRRRSGAAKRAPLRDVNDSRPSPLSPMHTNPAIPVSRRGSAHRGHATSKAKFDEIMQTQEASQRKKQFDRWMDELRVASTDPDGIENFRQRCESDLNMRTSYYRMHPWYLAWFHELGPWKRLPQIIVSDSDARERRDGSLVLIHQATHKHGGVLTNAVAFDTLVSKSDATDKWLSNLLMGPLLDSVQHDLKQAGRSCSILHSELIGTELMSATTALDAVTEQQLLAAMALTAHGRSAQWYKQDNIFFPWMNDLQNHWYAYHFRRAGHSWCARRYDSMQCLRKVKGSTQVAQLYDKDKLDLAKLELLLKFAARSWSEEAPEDREAKALVKSLEGKIEFESKIWPPRQKDLISCGIYTVYNIALAGLGINLTPSLYCPVEDERVLRQKCYNVLFDACEERRECWYTQERDDAHVHARALDMSQAITLSGPSTRSRSRSLQNAS